MAAAKNVHHMVPDPLIGLLVLFLELRLRPPNPKLVHQISPVTCCFSILSHDPDLSSILCPPAPDHLDYGSQGWAQREWGRLQTAWDSHTQEKYPLTPRVPSLLAGRKGESRNGRCLSNAAGLPSRVLMSPLLSADPDNRDPDVYKSISPPRGGPLDLCGRFCPGPTSRGQFSSESRVRKPLLSQLLARAWFLGSRSQRGVPPSPAPTPV